MARIRTVKPEFYTHEGLNDLPSEWHLLAGALLNYADDYGFFRAHPKLVLAGTLPLRPTLDVPAALEALAAIGYVRLGTGPDGRRYGQVVNFAKHQRVEHPSKKSIIDGIDVTWDGGSRSPREASGNTHEALTPEQGTGNREQGSGNGESESARTRARAADDPPDNPIARIEDQRPGHHHHLGDRDLGAAPNADEGPPPAAPPSLPRNDAAFVFEGPIFSIPAKWARSKVKESNGGMSMDDITRFGRVLTAVCEQEGAGLDGGHLLRFLDQHLERWRANPGDYERVAGGWS